MMLLSDENLVKEIRRLRLENATLREQLNKVSYGFAKLLRHTANHTSSNGQKEEILQRAAEYETFITINKGR